MKKFFSTELLWLVITIVLSIPLAFLWLAALDIVSADRQFELDEQIFVVELFLLAYAVSFGGIYLIRLIAGAIKSMAAPEK